MFWISLSNVCVSFFFSVLAVIHPRTKSKVFEVQIKNTTLYLCQMAADVPQWQNGLLIGDGINTLFGRSN